MPSVPGNILDRQFEATGPNKWIADFTYIWTGEGWLYSAVIDLFSRRVVGWSMSATMTTQLVADAPVDGGLAGGKPKELLSRRRRSFSWSRRAISAAWSADGVACVTGRHAAAVGSCRTNPPSVARPSRADRASWRDPIDRRRSITPFNGQMLVVLRDAHDNSAQAAGVCPQGSIDQKWPLLRRSFGDHLCLLQSRRWAGGKKLGTRYIDGDISPLGAQGRDYRAHGALRGFHRARSQLLRQLSGHGKS
ncbi:DDE-type integrase/transposase/recombinase [Bradyrhizobium sp. TZ2]